MTSTENKNLETYLDQFKDSLIDQLRDYEEFVINQYNRDEQYAIGYSDTQSFMMCEGDELSEMVSSEEIYADKIISTLLDMLEEYIEQKDA